MSDRTTTRQFTAPEIEADLKQFLKEQTKSDWEADTDLFASGGVSSLFAMELLYHMEQTYGIAIEGPNLRIDNFRTVKHMTELVLRLIETDAGE